MSPSLVNQLTNERAFIDELIDLVDRGLVRVEITEGLDRYGLTAAGQAVQQAREA